MSTGFNTQTGGGEYRLQFETDNKEYFLLMQELARCCVDHQTMTNADRIRAMSDEELAAFMNNFDVCDTRKNDECKFIYLADCKECVLAWLRQPAEEDHHAD